MRRLPTDRSDRIRAVGRSALSAVLLVSVVVSLLVAGVSGPVLASGPASAANAPTGVQETDTPSDEAVFDDPEELEALVDDLIGEEMAKHDVPGATVAVVEGDETVLVKGYGEADIETGEPVRANETAFMIGSVGKLVTWTAVMQGVEDGTLDLDEDVNTYLEDSEVEISDTYDEPVTLRHLGTHTAGFDTRLNPGMVENPDEVTSLETALVETQPDRVSPPGEEPRYSNWGTMLAGHVVAEAHDTTFEQYVHSEIFEPLEMDHSTFAQPVPDDQPGELAAPHMPTADGVERDDRVYINWRPAGSMSATATDMATFMSAHLGDGAAGDARILEPETAETMHDVHHERHPALTDWRYGFYEYGPPEDDLIAHSGGTVHETTKLVLAPEEDVGVFVSYNVRNEEALPEDAVGDVLAAYDLTSEPTASEDSTESTDGDERALERAETVDGEYELSMVPDDGPEQALGVVTRLSIDATDDGRLESHTLGFDEQEWVETEPYVYQEVDGDDVLVAEVDGGTVEAVHLNSAPMATFDPVATHERTAVVGATVGAALAGFALSILGWIGLAAWRGWRRYRTQASGDVNGSPGGEADATTTSAIRGRLESRFRSRSWLARAAGVALCVVSLAFVGLFLAAFGTAGELAFVTMPLALRVALALPPFVAALAVATAVGTALAWYDGYWSRRGRIHQTALAVLGVAFTWQLFQLGLLGL
ncbi:serine hydrolase domain-containing protein [Natrarchaeobius sp. A-rgal3]|uniref:serine hydrolase domain-containing protein n=1 Tax=Natrarchaeobius versutus TaxID=1679078 RepID=UPI00350F507C